MEGHFVSKVQAPGVEPRIIAGSFAGNGTGTPALASSLYPVGVPFTVARSATGTFAVSMPAGFGTPAQPHTIQITPNPDTAGDWFDACVIGTTTLTAATRAFTVLTHRGGTALDPTGRVGFAIHFDNSTGR